MLALLALACASPQPEGPPCEQVGAPGLEIAPSDVDFGAFQSGDALFYGTPPQGGAAYSPFHARASGVADLDEGSMVTLSAVDTSDGSDLGAIAYDVRFVCANVGDSAGLWVGSDLHLRFEGWGLDELEGRPAEVTIEVTDHDGAMVSASIQGRLTPF